MLKYRMEDTETIEEMEDLRQYVEHRVTLSDDEWRKFSAIFTTKSYPKGRQFMDTGLFNTRVWYIRSGMMRLYYISDSGEEVTLGLLLNDPNHPHGRFIGDISSYFLGRESDLYMDVLEESTVFECSFAALDAVFEESLKLMKLGKLYMQEQYTILENYHKTLRSLSAKDRYLLYRERAPIFEQALSNAQFASLLNIAPQSLSRIKSQI